MVKYKYTAYGKVTVTKDTDGLADVNPFKYKGYYFDLESGMYYCHTRYYVPEWGRWLNLNDIQGLDFGNCSKLNLFVYCKNAPTEIISNISGISKNHISASKTNTDVMIAGSGNCEISIQKKRSNHIIQHYFSKSLFDNVIGGFLGNVSITVTASSGPADTFYSFVNTGDSYDSLGIGLNLNDRFGMSAYISGNGGVGMSAQIQHLTVGFEVSLLEGVKASAGITIGNTTIEGSVNVGLPALALYAVAVAIATAPVPGGRILGGIVALIAFLL